VTVRLPAFAFALTCWTAAAGAFTGRCVLQVEGKTYLNGPCPIVLDKGGDFSIGVDEKTPSKFFAMVSLSDRPGVADGFWNGPDAEGHAHYPLGTLTRQGACWVNGNTKVCAMK